MAKGIGGIRAGRARYAKGKVAVSVAANGIFKGRGGDVIEGMGGKFSSRERAYIMSPTAYNRSLRMIRAGYAYNPFSKTFYKPSNLSGPTYTRQEMVRRFSGS